MVDRLKTETEATIVLLSLAPITEAPDHPGYKKAALYSSIIKKVALEKNVSYLPLYEKMDTILRQQNPAAQSDFDGYERSLLYKAIFYHHVAGYSWDEVSTVNEFMLQTDNIHLNRRGAMMIADLIDEFLRNDYSQKPAKIVH
ncbi:MAG: hypothetical protein HOE30_24605 [Deltaproteobacteria bacterium]|jgi:hypothetical protein|nr:hypothetical protein [Deltaproteobacteria bacterium]MBT4269554.1 hypothetical protein [Deltaproteobacteria bacterium]MBT4642117.1 hypothetical protein [Deltaproteobacteria bacterium]MBT6767345.1 hypothetical protein [Prolixibacteraceae bacterium]MBT7711934.1 hypothetical protein [Deltaproteobacteria bacterium]